MDYKELPTGYIQRAADAAIIPPDPDNSDYQKFLEWTRDGNFPDPVPAPSLPSVAATDRFLGLFTDDELAAMVTADPKLVVWLLKLTARQRVDLRSSETNAQLELAVKNGAITSDRKTQLIVGASRLDVAISAQATLDLER